MSDHIDPLGSLVINIEVRRQLLRDLLCTAVEGGSNYWANFANAERTPDLDYLKVRVTEQVASKTDVARANRYVTADDLSIGLTRLANVCADEKRLLDFPAAPKHLMDALTDNHDATTADVVLQMTMFGELIYG